jgi:hypothetical protein
MNMILLVEAWMLPVPPGIEVLQIYGEESIRPNSPGPIHQGIVRGTVMLLKGEGEAFVQWLKAADGVWTTLNPMTSKWKVVHTKER